MAATAAALFIRRWVLRPSVWIALISIVAYWDSKALHGAFNYDDAGSVKGNDVVNGKLPWQEVFKRDYWGQNMTDIQSHKSFRPITTITFRLNWLLSEKVGTNGTENHTYGFHLVNIGLHGVVTALVTETSGFVFDQGTEADCVAQIITGLIFALHPVHAEVVSNITSRGEMLMSLFFLLAFLSFATQLRPQQQRPILSVVAIYLVPWLCMTLSLFCKEQGATTLITLVLFDFLLNHGSVTEYIRALFVAKDAKAIEFFRRTLILAIQTIIVCLWRRWLNGETSPDFIFDQNPAGFSEDRFTRVFSVSWVYCLYIFDALWPMRLSPDWSGVSIPLIENWADKRVFVVMALWVAAVACLQSLVFGLSSDATKDRQETRRTLLTAFFAFTFSPFLLSSNLLVVVGLMKADRVIYLPLLGFCIMEALLFKILFYRRAVAETKSKTPTAKRRPTYWLGYVIVLTQLALFSAKLHERNIAWSSALNLWMAAYRINPISRHTIYNCGYELAQKGRYDEAEYVMRPIADPSVDGPSNTFVYCMVLYNLDECATAHKYLDKAFRVIGEKRKRAGTRDTPKSLDRAESNLLVARSFCLQADDLPKAGKIMYEAVEKDPTNEYAINSAAAMLKNVQKIQTAQMVNERRRKLGLK